MKENASWSQQGSIYVRSFEACPRRIAPHLVLLVRWIPLIIHAQYDWTTGVLDNGNEWRKFHAAPRLYPLRSLVCTLFNKGGSRGAFRLPGAGGDHFHRTVEPSPGHIRCRIKPIYSLLLAAILSS